MKLEGKTICVTGATGFLGRHLCSGLVDRGAKVLALDNLSIGSQDAIEELPGRLSLIQADIRDPETIIEPLSEADIVYHLAAIANPRTCASDFGLAFDVNVRGTAHVLKASQHVERFICLSSIMVYGEPRYLPIDERHPLEGRDPYCASKIICEELVKISNFIHELPYTIVRNSNTYGPHQSNAYLAPTLIQQGLDAGVIEIWDPKVIRDFLYVDDTVEALIGMAETEAASGEIINLGGGLGVSAGELADVICNQLGTSWVDVKKPAAVSSKLIADTSKLQALTGWQRQVSLEDGIARTVEHFKSLVPGALK
jgi:nucleoside-diphosphate-sugar epimerase